MTNSFSISAPVIVTGRGGSGTRLIANILENLPIYMGSRLNGPGDSLDWVSLSRDILFGDVSLSNGRFDDEWGQRFILNAQEYLSKAPDTGCAIWGWKLPEMMYCMPEMKHCFPNAKFVHLVRHPVSLSLRRTHISSRLDNEVGRTVLTRAYKNLGIDVNTISERSDSFNNAVSWYFQVKPVVEFAAQNLPAENYMVIRYEDLVAAPATVTERLCSFVGLDLPAGKPAVEIDPTRTNLSFDKNQQEAIDEVWSMCGALAESFGYKKYPIYQN